MSNNIPKIYSKIKNFTEKDQVRVKYSYIGKDKKLMLSVYIGEDVYNELTNGQTFKRLKVEYIPNDMVIITPTNEEKKGIVHRYNGKGLFKTTCVRLSLSSYKKLKISKKDFNNRVVGYLFASRSDGKCLNVDLIGNKRKSKFIHDNAIREIINLDNIVPQDYVSNSKIKPLEISAPKEVTSDHFLNEVFNDVIDYKPMFVTHHFLNDVRDAIESRLLGIEERFEKRIQNLEYLEQRITEVEDKIEELDSLLTSIEGHHDDRIGTLEKENSLDIDTFKQLIGKSSDEMKIRFSNLEKTILELETKNVDIKSRLSIIINLLSDKKSHEHKSLFEKIFGKD